MPPASGIRQALADLGGSALTFSDSASARARKTPDSDRWSRRLGPRPGARAAKRRCATHQRRASDMVAEAATRTVRAGASTAASGSSSREATPRKRRFAAGVHDERTGAHAPRGPRRPPPVDGVRHGSRRRRLRERATLRHEGRPGTQTVLRPRRLMGSPVGGLDTQPRRLLRLQAPRSRLHRHRLVGRVAGRERTRRRGPVRRPT
jgi:hypothetical protein